MQMYIVKTHHGESSHSVEFKKFDEAVEEYLRYATRFLGEKSQAFQDEKTYFEKINLEDFVNRSFDNPHYANEYVEIYVLE